MVIKLKTSKEMIKQMDNQIVILTNFNDHFKAYFNNKMTLLLLIIEHPGLAKRALSRERAKWFLHDLYHHFIPHGTAPRYRHAFRWLELFLDRNWEVSPHRTLRAIRMIGLIYEAFGMRLGRRLESIRLEGELMKAGKKEEARHV